MPGEKCAGQRTAYKNWFSPAKRVPEIDLDQAGWEVFLLAKPSYWPPVLFYFIF